MAWFTLFDGHVLLSQENVAICTHMKVKFSCCNTLCLLLKRATHTFSSLIHITIHNHSDRHGHHGITVSIQFTAYLAATPVPVKLETSEFIVPQMFIT